MLGSVTVSEGQCIFCRFFLHFDLILDELNDPKL